MEVIAVAQEDKDLESHARMRANLKPEPRFELVADIDRAKTGAYKRTTTYLIDANGVVRQVFPHTLRSRGSWDAVLSELDRLEGR